MSLFKFAGLIISLFAEKDKKKAEAKAKVAGDMVNAYKETDPKIRASRINAVSDDIDGL
jgi:hypothetical protein